MPRWLLISLALVAIGIPGLLVAGCVAALLTSQTIAKPKGPDVVLVDVLVASKELAPRTRFTKDSLKDQMKRKKSKPDEVPGNAVTDEADLIDRQPTKTLRADDYVGHGDLGSYKHLEPPAGKDLMTIRVAVEWATPVLKTGFRIDIFGSGIKRQNKEVDLRLLPEVLVMAEGVTVKPPTGGAAGSNTQLVAVAVNTEEAMLIRMCGAANVRLSCIVRSETDTKGGHDLLTRYRPDRPFHWWTDKERGDLGAVVTVKLPVPTEDLPAGTEITAELIDKKFKDVKFAATVPEDSVTNLTDQLGRVLVEKVAACQFTSRSYIKDSPKDLKSRPSENTNVKTHKHDSDKLLEALLLMKAELVVEDETEKKKM